MQQRSNDDNKRLMARLDDIAREMNAFLVVLAIGLATLDATCYWAKTVSDAFAHSRPPVVAASNHLPSAAVTASAADDVAPPVP